MWSCLLQRLSLLPSHPPFSYRHPILTLNPRTRTILFLYIVCFRKKLRDQHLTLVLLWLGYSKLPAQVLAMTWPTDHHAISTIPLTFTGCRTALHPGHAPWTHCRRPAVEINPLAWSQHHVPFLHNPPPGQRDMKSSKRPRSFKESYARFKTYRKYRFFYVSILPSSSWQNLTDLLLQQTAEGRGWDEVKEAGFGLQWLKLL